MLQGIQVLLCTGGVSSYFSLDDFAFMDESLLPHKRYKKDMESVIEFLNFLSKNYLETKDERYFILLRQFLPSSFKYTSNITMNFETLFTMYNQRKTHRLPEWNCDFVNWAKNDVEYFKGICLKQEEIRELRAKRRAEGRAREQARLEAKAEAKAKDENKKTTNEK